MCRVKVRIEGDPRNLSQILSTQLPGLTLISERDYDADNEDTDHECIEHDLDNQSNGILGKCDSSINSSHNHANIPFQIMTVMKQDCPRFLHRLTNNMIKTIHNHAHHCQILTVMKQDYPQFAHRPLTNNVPLTILTLHHLLEHHHFFHT